MRIFVTGAAGFIGSHLCERLLDENHQVLGADNFDRFYSEEQKIRNISQLIPRPGFEFVQVDVRSTQQLRKALAGHQITKVVHLAGRGGVVQSTKRPFQYLDQNIKGTVALLETCKDLGIEGFISASSSSVYGEVGRELCTETRSTDRPASIYAASKKCTELMAHAYHALYGTPIVNVRFFSVYGPRGRPDQVIYRMTQLIDEEREIPWIEPEPERDFTYIDDIVDGLVAVLAAPALSYHTINLGYGKPQAMGRVIDVVEQALGKKARIAKCSQPRGPHDVSASHADIALATQLFGWRPKVDLAEGVPKFVAWYLRERRASE